MGWQLLGAIGLLLIVAAAVGGGVELAGVGKIGEVRSRVAVAVCIVAGLAFLAMGYATWRGSPPASGRTENPAVLIVDRVMDSIDRLVAADGGPAAGAGARPAGPRNDQTITLSPTGGTAGTQVTVTGRGFDPGELVEVRFQAVLAATPTADGSGSFRTSISVPGTMARLHGAPLAVTASGRSSVRSAEATFTIQ